MGKVADSEANELRCICVDCPSKPQEDRLLYCARGKSPAKVRRRGCICGDCQNYMEYGLKNAYYCDEGVTE